jgi:phosphate transport system substrate-binding protein
MTRWMKMLFVAVLAMAGFRTEAAEEITIKGSDTLLQLSQLWAQNYSQKTGVKIQVNGGGTGTGFAALVNDSCDIANASRPIKSSERSEIVRKFKTRDREYKCAHDGIAIYVHESNKVPALTLKQLDDIFTGKVADWKEVGGTPGPIVMYGRENSSGTYEFFKEHVLKKKDFASVVQVLPGTAAIVNAVAKDPKSIGYGGLSYAKGVRLVPVKKDEGSAAIMPTEQTVIKHEYPIWRYLYMYTVADKDKGAVAQFIDWCTKDGQKLVEQAGYVPLSN